MHARVDKEGSDEDWPTTVDLTQRTPNERTDTVTGDKDRDKQGRDLSTKSEVDDHLRNHTRGSRRREGSIQNERSSEGGEHPTIISRPVLGIELIVGTVEADLPIRFSTLQLSNSSSLLDLYLL